MSEQSLLRRLIADTEADMDTLAHQVTAAGMNDRSYMMASGRYRALKAQVIKFRALLEGETDSDDDPDDEGEEPETVTLQAAQTRPPRRRHKARNWGGN